MPRNNLGSNDNTNVLDHQTLVNIVNIIHEDLEAQGITVSCETIENYINNEDVRESWLEKLDRKWRGKSVAELILLVCFSLLVVIAIAYMCLYPTVIFLELGAVMAAVFVLLLYGILKVNEIYRSDNLADVIEVIRKDTRERYNILNAESLVEEAVKEERHRLGGILENKIDKLNDEVLREVRGDPGYQYSPNSNNRHESKREDASNYVSFTQSQGNFRVHDDIGSGKRSVEEGAAEAMPSKPSAPPSYC